MYRRLVFLLALISICIVACKKKEISYTENLSNVRHWKGTSAGHSLGGNYSHGMSYPVYSYVHQIEDTLFGLNVTDSKTVEGLQYDAGHSTGNVYYLGNIDDHFGLHIAYYVERDSIVMHSYNYTGGFTSTGEETTFFFTP